MMFSKSSPAIIGLTQILRVRINILVYDAMFATQPGQGIISLTLHKWNNKLTTILDKIKWNSKPPSPPNQGWSCAKSKNAPFPIFDLGGGVQGFPSILSKIVAFRTMDEIHINNNNNNNKENKFWTISALMR